MKVYNSMTWAIQKRTLNKSSVSWAVARDSNVTLAPQQYVSSGLKRGVGEKEEKEDEDFIFRYRILFKYHLGKRQQIGNLKIVLPTENN